MRWWPLMLAVLIAGSAGLAAAASRIADEREAYQRAQAASAVASRRAATLERAAATSKDRADQAREQARLVAARIQAAEAELAVASARLALVDRLLQAQRSRIAERQGPIVRLTAALQSLARRPALLLLVQPGSIADLVHVRALLGGIAPVLEARTAGLRADLERIRTLRREAGQAEQTLADVRQRLASERAELTAMEAAQRTLARRFADSSSLEADRATALAEDARDIADLVTELEADGVTRDRLALLPGPVPRPLVAGADAALPSPAKRRPAARPPYRLPVIGPVVAGLGEAAQSGARSRGLTIATTASALVVAPASGRVAYAGPYRGYGRIVIVDHGGGWTTLLTGLGSLSVAVGDTVDQGSPLGRAGPGRPEITVELRRSGNPVDIARLVS